MVSNSGNWKFSACNRNEPIFDHDAGIKVLICTLFVTFAAQGNCLGILTPFPSSATQLHGNVRSMDYRFQ